MILFTEVEDKKVLESSEENKFQLSNLFLYFQKKLQQISHPLTFFQTNPFKEWGTA